MTTLTHDEWMALECAALNELARLARSSQHTVADESRRKDLLRALDKAEQLAPKP